MADLQLGSIAVLVDMDADVDLQLGAAAVLVDMDADVDLQLGTLAVLVDAYLTPVECAVAALQQTEQPVREKIEATAMGSPGRGSPYSE